MLSDNIYSLIENFLIGKKAVLCSTDCLSNSLKEILNIRLTFLVNWNKKLHISNFIKDFSYSYNILEENKDFIKCCLNIYINSIYYKNLFTTHISKNLLLIEKADYRFRIISLINQEENNSLFNYYFHKSIDYINFSSITIPLTQMWTNTLNKIDSLYDSFLLNICNNKPRTKSLRFNVEKASAYAQHFAIIPNNQYKSFENYGGDCTNFVSQILHSGDIKTTPKWKPYTHSWIRVEEFYSYIINSNIGIDLTKEKAFSKGSFLQFSTYERKKFFHSGFITYELKNDYLYCCHTYNKLNYPLSQVYPFIYPLIRIIRII